jgi:PAS domain S-box-containing protein
VEGATSSGAARAGGVPRAGAPIGRTGRTSWRFIALGFALLALRWLDIGTEPEQAILYLALSLSVPLAIVVGIRRHRPDAEGPWRLIALASFLRAVGECVWYFQHSALNVRDPFGYSDAFYLGSGGVLFVAIRVLAKAKRGDRRIEPLLDAAIVAGAGAILLWYSSVSSITGQNGPSITIRILVATYPIVDLVLLTMVVHLTFLRKDHTWSGRLLLLGTLALTLSDFSYAVARQHASSQPHWMYAGWVLWFVCFGAAALHPSMVRVSNPPARPGRPHRVVHTAIIGLAVLLGPCLGLVAEVHERDKRLIGLEVLTLVVVAIVLIQVGAISADRERHRERSRSEVRLRSLVQHATDAICILDRSDRLIYASPALAEIIHDRRSALDAPAPFLTGLMVDDLVVEEDIPLLRSLLSGARGGSASLPARAELRLSLPGGSHTLTDVTAVDYGGEDGIDGTVLNVRDISYRLEARREVQRSEEQLRAAAAHLPIVLLACDARGVFTLSEGLALSHLGLNPGELVGRPLGSGPPSCQPIVDALQPLLTGAVEFLSVDVVLAGRTFQLNGSTGSFDGGSTGLLAIATDVTDRVRGEQRARAMARRQRASAELWTTILHTTFDSDRLMNEVMSKTAAALNATCAVVIARSDGELWTRVVGGWSPPFEEATRAVLEAGTVPSVPCVLTPEGLRALEETEGCRSVAFPIRTQGTSVGLLMALRGHAQAPFDSDDYGFLVNITERTALALDNARLLGEAQRELAERRHSEQILRASEQRWRAFGTEASHQLRTPLTGLRLRIENELLTLNDMDPTAMQRRGVLVELLGDVENLEVTVSDFLSLVPSRLQSAEPLDVAKLVEETATIWRPRIEAAGRVLAVRVERKLPLALISEAAVRQVLGVLLENALQHGGGAVTLAAREMGGGVAMEVSDEGPGFAQARPDTPDRSRHNIGLRLARSLADAEGARVQVSKPGPMPTVMFSVPGWATDIEAVSSHEMAPPS